MIARSRVTTPHRVFARASRACFLAALTLAAIPTLVTAGSTFVAPAAAAAPESLAQPVSLRQGIRIEGDVVLLGDVFEGLERGAETPIARAPAPGESVTLNARWLGRLAQAYNVAWRPRSTLDEATLTREAQVLDRPAIMEAIRTALEDAGVSDRFEIQLDNPNQRLEIPTDAPGVLTAHGVTMNPESGRFQMTLAAGDPQHPVLRTPVTGRALRLVEVPVPARRIEAGGIITESDIEWIDLRADRLGPRDARNAEDLVGQSARRPLAPGEVVRLSQIQQPVLVNRNKLVTIELRTPTMRLTARGRALDDGARGDVVRVMNTASNKTVMAVVTADATVAVDPDADLR